MPSAPSYRASLADTLALLQEIEQRHAPAALSNGFGPESMVLTDLIARHNLAIDIFSLNTGRLPPETYHLAQLARRRYGLRIHLFTPKPEELEPWLAAHGPDAFYDSVERRHECCAIRKVSSLNRALAGRKAWLTGLRREQSAHRSDLEAREWDAAHQMHKFNPMVHWTHREVWDYIRDFDVPHNALHKRGYASIGCAPCTRAITAGEDIRAVRWWWEQDDLKECGLHVQQTVNTSNSSKTTPARPAGVSPHGARSTSNWNATPSHRSAPWARGCAPERKSPAATSPFTTSTSRATTSGCWTCSRNGGPMPSCTSPSSAPRPTL